MKRIMTTVLASGLALAAPIAASAAENPIFGAAKVHNLDDKAMKSIVGTNATSSYYAYYGNLYSEYAINYASYSQYLDNFGTTYRSSQTNYYAYAYSYAYTASQYYLAAYHTN